MIIIFIVLFLPAVVSILLYYYMNANVQHYQKIPGFTVSCFQIPEEELRDGFGKPVMMDLIKLSLFASIFLFMFLLYTNVFLFLIEIVILILLGSYFQNRANERLQELCDIYHVERRKNDTI